MVRKKLAMSDIVLDPISGAIIQNKTPQELLGDFVHNSLKNIGMDRVVKLERAYGKDDLRVKKAKLECFFKAYAVLGTVRYAAQFVGLSHTKVEKVIKNSEKYAARFEQAHVEFAEYLEQTAVMRALLGTSDGLLWNLLKANNPQKFSERLRLQALDAKDLEKSAVQLVFPESSGANEINFAVDNAMEAQYVAKEEPEDDNTEKRQ